MRRNPVFVILTIFLGLNILAWLAVYDLSRSRFLEVTFFDVGQGDAIFIETPKGNKILIDGGPDSALLEKLGENLPFWDRTIDLLILTHPESDHLTGLLEVLRSYKVKNILWTGILMDTAGFKKWEKLIKQENAKIYLAQAGQKIIISPKIVLEVLHPFENLEGKSVKDVNNTSIVLRLDFLEISFLFTGDVYKSAEKELVEQGSNINSDVLKVGHHGSKTSSDEEFIKEVLPEMAVISVGKNNSYGHPHSETLAILEKYGISIFRTDLNGDIKIISDGINYEVSNFQN